VVTQSGTAACLFCTARLRNRDYRYVHARICFSSLSPAGRVCSYAFAACLDVRRGLGDRKISANSVALSARGATNGRVLPACSGRLAYSRRTLLFHHLKGVGLTFTLRHHFFLPSCRIVLHPCMRASLQHHLLPCLVLSATFTFMRAAFTCIFFLCRVTHSGTAFC